MIIYILFSILMFIIANIDVTFTKNKLIVKYILFLFIVLVIGLRYELGVDWLFYRDFFNNKDHSVSLMEPGYKLLSSFTSFLGFDFWLFICIINIFILLVLYYFFKKYSPFHFFCLSIYFISSFSFNVEALRQIIAVAIFYIALKYYLNNEKKKYIAICLFASSFHISAILLLILPFIDNFFLKKLMKMIILVGLVMPMIGLYPVETILEKLTLLPDNSYIEKVILYSLPANNSNAFSFNLFFKILIICYFFFKKKYIYYEFINKKISLSILSSLESLILLMLIIDVYFYKYGIIISRINEYFSPIFIILVSYLIMINKHIVNKIIFSFIFSSCVLISFIRFSSNEYFQKQYIPYRNSLYFIIINENKFLTREQDVKLHWIERKK